MRSECLRICACTGTLCRTAPDPVFSLSDTPPSVLVLRLEALLLVLMLLSSSSLLSFFLFLILDFKTNLSIIQPKKKTQKQKTSFFISLSFSCLIACWLVYVFLLSKHPIQIAYDVSRLCLFVRWHSYPSACPPPYKPGQSLRPPHYYCAHISSYQCF